MKTWELEIHRTHVVDWTAVVQVPDEWKKSDVMHRVDDIVGQIGEKHNRFVAGKYYWYPKYSINRCTLTDWPVIDCTITADGQIVDADRDEYGDLLPSEAVKPDEEAG